MKWIILIVLLLTLLEWFIRKDLYPTESIYSRGAICTGMLLSMTWVLWEMGRVPDEH